VRSNWSESLVTVISLGYQSTFCNRTKKSAMK